MLEQKKILFYLVSGVGITEKGRCLKNSEVKPWLISLRERNLCVQSMFFILKRYLSH